MKTEPLDICEGCYNALIAGKTDFLVCSAAGYFVLARVVEKPDQRYPWGVTIREVEGEIIPSLEAAEFCCGVRH